MEYREIMVFFNIPWYYLLIPSLGHSTSTVTGLECLSSIITCNISLVSRGLLCAALTKKRHFFQKCIDSLIGQFKSCLQKSRAEI